jgi:aryl-alcohol dehydrogenase-like predicted oxidoreductase
LKEKVEEKPPETQKGSYGKRLIGEEYSREAMEGNRRIVEAVKAVAERLGATPAQVTIAWALAQGEHAVPIPGTKKMRRLQENAAAADLDLPEHALAELDRIPASVAPRY